MRPLFAVGGMALACLSLALSATAAELYADDAQPSAARSFAVSSDEGSLLASPATFDGGCCDDACYDCCDCFNGRQRIGFLPSDHCFDRFISPLSNPFYFEDPRSLTEARGIFLEQAIPSSLGGSDLRVYAAQLRGRITDRVSVIAMRLGHFQVNQPGDAPDGFLSAPVGLKYNFIRDVDRQLLVTGGFTYFIKGSGGAASNFGDGDFHFFLTGGKQILDNGHWLSATGFRIPGDRNWGTQMWYWSNQWDYEVADGIYPLVGINWFHWLSSAGVPSGSSIMGLDLLNLPANFVAGNDVVTGVAGLRWKPSPHVVVGTGFEFPLTNRDDILKNRLYVDLILRY